MSSEKPFPEPRWLTFNLWNDFMDRPAEKVLQINALYVVAVVEGTRRHPYGGNQEIAVLRMYDGNEYTVEDPARQATKRIKEHLSTRETP